MHEPPSHCRTLLIISQVYVPDPAAVGQYMHEAAAAMVQRGHRVIVYTARRGYDDARQRYAPRETRDGVEIRRLPLASLGKRSMAARLIGGMLFLMQVIVRGLFVRDLGGVLVSTSPPMAPLAALVLRILRRVPFVFWAMDINPDQMIALGRTRDGSLPARVFDWLVRATLRRGAHVVTLDAFMAERLEAKVKLGERISVIPPWPLEDQLEPVAHADNPFRREHAMDGCFVVMYSGNLSPAHPIETVLEAAKALRDEPRVLFVFVGGGALRSRIETEALSNVRVLPYQSLDRLRYSLSAADVHLVAMGEAMVGIVHPCKVYGAMAVARPVLLLGPARCHAGQLIASHEIGWRVDHGDVDGAVAVLREMARMDDAALAAMGARAREAARSSFGKRALCGAFCDLLERHLC
ncbi:MAG: glycosyltransferase family 4 protein [Phycisphaeraceae bacterium]